MTTALSGQPWLIDHLMCGIYVGLPKGQFFYVITLDQHVIHRRIIGHNQYLYDSEGKWNKSRLGKNQEKQTVWNNKKRSNFSRYCSVMRVRCQRLLCPVCGSSCIALACSSVTLARSCHRQHLLLIYTLLLYFSLLAVI